MIDQTTLEGKIITAAFDLAASPGWAEVSLRDIADAAGCPLDEVMQHFTNKNDVLGAFIARVDARMLAGAGDIEREQSPRDALFEVIMSRFDAMAPYRAGLKSILSARGNTAAVSPRLACLALRTQNRILETAGISKSGMPALLRQLGLARIYGEIFRIWLDDDDPGMARTMAALDRRLRQGEQTLRTVSDAARSAERLCTQAASVASRIFAGGRTAGRRGSNRKDETAASPDQPPPDTAPDGTAA